MPSTHQKPFLVVPENRKRWRMRRPRKKTKAGGLLKTIANRAGKAVEQFDLIEKDDRILIGLSGGKDSWTLLEVCLHLQETAPIDFEIAAIHLDLGNSNKADTKCSLCNVGFSETKQYLEGLGAKTYFLQTDIEPRVKKMNRDHSSSPCFLCARFRRGILYRTATDLGYNKIALGHHADDLIETLLMNQFFSGQLKSMPPKLFADDGKNIVIRPLCTVFETQTRQYVSLRNIPIIKSMCGHCEWTELPRREWIKQWLSEMESKAPGLKGYLLASLSHVRPSHLMDTKFFDFVKGFEKQ